MNNSLILCGKGDEFREIGEIAVKPSVVNGKFRFRLSVCVTETHGGTERDAIDRRFVGKIPRILIGNEGRDARGMGKAKKVNVFPEKIDNPLKCDII